MTRKLFDFKYGDLTNNGTRVIEKKVYLYSNISSADCAKLCILSKGKQEIDVGIFLGLICNASGFISDTSYTTKKLGHTAEKNRR